MNAVKKFMGVAWLLLAAAAAYFSIFNMGLPKLTTGKTEDLVFGIIILFVLTPIIVGGLFIFGRYALSGEYDTEE